MKLKSLLAVIASVAVLGVAYAEDRFGVTVYPAAKYDPDTSRSVKDMLKREAACFTTADGVSKVADFYQKQGLENVGGVTSEGALFRKGGVEVTIQSPWMNMKNGSMMKDTLVSIVKTK